MEVAECRRLFAGSDHAYLATVGADLRPHLVPVTCAVDGDVVVHAVDAKPKRTTELRRLRNIAANPRVCFLADHYEQDWTRLWWVRADAQARVLTDGAERDQALELLARRHPPYRAQPPAGPVVWAVVSRWTGWSA